MAKEQKISKSSKVEFLLRTHVISIWKSWLLSILCWLEGWVRCSGWLLCWALRDKLSRQITDTSRHRLATTFLCVQPCVDIDKKFDQHWFLCKLWFGKHSSLTFASFLWWCSREEWHFCYHKTLPKRTIRTEVSEKKENIIKILFTNPHVVCVLYEPKIQYGVLGAFPAIANHKRPVFKGSFCPEVRPFLKTKCLVFDFVLIWP